MMKYRRNFLKFFLSRSSRDSLHLSLSFLLLPLCLLHSHVLIIYDVQVDPDVLRSEANGAVTDESDTAALRALYKNLELECMQQMQLICDSSHTGAKIEAVQIDSFGLLDHSLLQELEKITKFTMASRSAVAEGEFKRVQAEADKKVGADKN